MLIITPPALYGHLGALLSALIVVCACIGLTLHKDVYAHTPRSDFYWYYTNVSNLIVLLYFALIAPWLYARAALRRFIPAAEFSVMMVILLTHVVFHNLLFPDILRAARKTRRTRETDIMAADNLFIHYLVPWLTCLYWLLCSPDKDALTLPGALVWLAVPLIYLLCLFLRARRGNLAGTDSPYPYPFLDVQRLGAGRVARICLLLLALCVLVSLALLLAVRLSFARWGGGHALVLV